MSESVILCEGYLDRAFLAGWLTHLGWQNARYKTGTLKPGIAYDPSGKPVQGSGQYAYYSSNNRFVRLIPVHGRGNILIEVKNQLASRELRGLGHLVLAIDTDVDTADAEEGATGLTIRDVAEFVKRLGLSVTLEGKTITVEAGTQVSLICWDVDDPQTLGLPNQQTLERLVSAALIGAFPERGSAFITGLILAITLLKRQAQKSMPGRIWQAGTL